MRFVMAIISGRHSSFSFFSAILYFFLVYRASGGGNPMAGFEFPGAADRRRIKQLQADIHHLDKPHLHLQLADIYFNQGKLDLAEASYKAAYERDSLDEDIRAHYATCLFAGAGRRRRCRSSRPSVRKTRSTITATR